MSTRFSDSLLPPGHELERLTRRARRTKLGSSVRSRSVPNIHDATGSDNGSRPSPVIYAQDYENSNAAVPLQIDDPDTTVQTTDGSHDTTELQGVALNDGSSSSMSKLAPERDDMTFSMQRSHSRQADSRQDSDQQSETETIVPRRNLTALDVASLILNKMVSATVTGMSLSADSCSVGWYRDLHDSGSCSWVYEVKACEPGPVACRRCVHASVVRRNNSLTCHQQAI